MRISTPEAFTYAATSLNGQQSGLAKLTAQLSSGKRITTPSDDPAGAARVIALQSALARNDQMRTTQAGATNTLTQAESLLGNINDAYTDIRSIMVQAGNPSLSDGDRKTLAAQLTARRDALTGLSTSRDTDGQPMFGSRLIQVGSSRALDVSLNSTQLFGQVRDGNGIFAASAAAGNTGSAAISAGSVANATALDGASYDISMHNVSGTVTYDVVNAGTGAVVSSGNAFTSGGAITVAGMSVQITGAPADGDTFHLVPSAQRTIFQSIDDVAQALKTPATDDVSRAKLAASLAAGLAQVDQAAQTAQLTQANAGAALNEIDTLQSVTGAQDDQLKMQLSAVEDLDYTQAATDLSQRQMSMDAAQKAYSKTLGHSLFDFM